REEPERLEGIVGSVRNRGPGQRTANVPLFGDVVEAADVCSRMRAGKLRERLREVRHAPSGANSDGTLLQVATEEAGQRTNGGSIAVPFDQHERVDIGHGTQMYGWHSDVVRADPG